MPLAASASQYIFQGIWTNWSKGATSGLTLTVDNYKAQFISPALAILVSVAGAQLWSIFQFALHQVRATSLPRNFFFHQQQTILRNPSTDLSTLWRLSRLALAWRHQRDVKVYINSLPLIVWTFIHFAVVLTAGALSSWALEAGDEVLSRSPFCGYLETSYMNSLLSTNISDTETVRRQFQYNTHMHSIYGGVQQRVDLCQNEPQECSSMFIAKPTWTSQTLTNGCPFQSSVCHPNITGSLSLDTGYMSSASIFGFNSKKDDRIALRMVAQCAPLDNSKYSTPWQADTTGSSTANVADVLYGTGSMNARNATYTITEPNLQCDERAAQPPYSLATAYLTPGGNISNQGGTFDPIREIEVSNADVSLIMLSYISSYTGPIYDPWFSAQRAFNDTNAYCMNQEGTLYLRDYPISTMGCTQQWQICNAENPRFDGSNSTQCTTLAAYTQMQAMLATTPPSIGLSASQLALAGRVVAAAATADFSHVVDALSQGSAPPLKARAEVAASIGVPLPDNQWEIETKYWMDIATSYLQHFSLAGSTGQFAADTSYITPQRPSSNDSAQQAAYEVCRTQLITSDAYRNYNFFALVFIVVLCGIITGLGLTIEDVAGYLRQRRPNNPGFDTKRDMWIANGVLELLKTIDEVKNGSKWTRTRNGIPITHSSNKITTADIVSEGVHVEKGIGTIHHAFRNHSASSKEFSTHHPSNAAPDPVPADSDVPTFHSGPRGVPQKRKDTNGFNNPYVDEIHSDDDLSAASRQDTTLLDATSNMPDGGDSSRSRPFAQHRYEGYQPPSMDYHHEGRTIREQRPGWGVLPTNFSFTSNLAGRRRPSSGYVQ